MLLEGEPNSYVFCLLPNVTGLKVKEYRNRKIPADDYKVRSTAGNRLGEARGAPIAI